MKPTDMNQKDKTSEKKLSQLMDGEWHDLDPADCVASLCADTALHAKWSRYHIIRDALKNEAVQPDAALAARICSVIQDEPTYSNITQFSGACAESPASESTEAAFPEEHHEPASAASFAIAAGESALPRSTWVNTGVAGFAVAASVALVTVVGLNLVQQQDQPAAVLKSVASAENTDNSSERTAVLAESSTFQQSDSSSLPVVEFIANTGSFWMSPESSTRVQDDKSLNVMLSHHIENSPTAGREGLLPYSRLVGYEESSQRR